MKLEGDVMVDSSAALGWTFSNVFGSSPCLCRSFEDNFESFSDVFRFDKDDVFRDFHPI